MPRLITKEVLAYKYGPDFLDRLTALWADKSITKEQVCRKLGINKNQLNLLRRRFLLPPRHRLWIDFAYLDNRYGEGFSERFKSMCNDSVLTYKQIAEKLGISDRQLVQWRRKLVTKEKKHHISMEMNFGKETFEKFHGADSFQKLLGYFENQGCKTLKEIGQEFGVTRERVRQWRTKLLADHPDWIKSGYQRRQIACTLPKQIEKAKSQRLAPIFDLLRQRGIDPKLYIYRRPYKNYFVTRASETFFFINGHKCQVHSAATKFVPSGHNRTTYWHFSFRPFKKLDYFLILVCGDLVKEIYVVPLGLLGPKRKKEKSIYVPTDYKNFGYNNHFPTIDWRPYKEAWHLLERKK